MGETVDDILAGYVAQIAEAAGSLATNIYHGKVLTLARRRQLVTQKNPLALRRRASACCPIRSPGT